MEKNATECSLSNPSQRVIDEECRYAPPASHLRGKKVPVFEESQLLVSAEAGFRQSFRLLQVRSGDAQGYSTFDERLAGRTHPAEEGLTHCPQHRLDATVA